MSNATVGELVCFMLLQKCCGTARQCLVTSAQYVLWWRGALL